MNYNTLVRQQMALYTFEFTFGRYEIDTAVAAVSLLHRKGNMHCLFITLPLGIKRKSLF